jgi:hypothetical protein
LRNANLSGADLSNADLSNADLIGANLRNANLSGAKNLPSQIKNNLNILKWQEKLVAFKYLNKDYTSPYRNFKYEIGKKYEFNCNKDERIICAEGGNIATLEWCLKETKNDIKNFIYIVCEFSGKDVIIPHCSDGKFRVNKFKIVRKLTKKELNEAIKVLNVE